MGNVSVLAGLALTAIMFTSSGASAADWVLIEAPDADAVSPRDDADSAVLGDDPEDYDAYEEEPDEDVGTESLGAGPSGPSTGPSKGGAKGPSRGPSCQCDVPARASLGGGWALGLGMCAAALALRTRRTRNA